MRPIVFFNNKADVGGMRLVYHLAWMLWDMGKRKDQASVLTRPKPEDLAQWLEEYTLGELWEKNILGGRPGR